MRAVPTTGAAQQLDELREILAESGDPVAVEAALNRLSATLESEHELRDRQTAENARLVESLAERQLLLERLSKIQNSIVSRRDLQEVLNAIVAGAKDLLGDETVGLRLIDPEDPTKMVSIGNLSDKPDVLLPIPPGTDLNQYRLVDVSDEPHDGNVAHSGHSLLRGTLTY